MIYAPRFPLSAVVFALALPGFVRAAEPSAWPAWRGASDTGAVPGAQPPVKWSDNQNIKWKTAKLSDKIDASPAIVGQELFLRGHQYLYCISER